MRLIGTLAVIGVGFSACSQAPQPNPPGVTADGPLVVDTQDDCGASGGYGFICGLQNAEDLVAVAETPWIIASSMAPGGAIYLVDSEQKTWTDLYPTDVARAEHRTATYAACPGPPDPNNFITHGLNLRLGEGGHSTLYVVSHGGREAIEVFEVDAEGGSPELTWTGCVMMPEGLGANSVASFSDGSLVATVLVYPDKTFSDMLSGEPTGAVYEWSPGESGFTLIEGTELPGNNGIEVSADEREMYVVSSGLRTVVAYSYSNPARQLRTTRPMDFLPDNLHMARDGRLITAGTVYDEPACGGAPSPEGFDLEEFAACPRGFIAAMIDPETMQDTDLAIGPANSEFSNATMALRVNDEVWVGTFSGDRIGYRSIDRND